MHFSSTTPLFSSHKVIWQKRKPGYVSIVQYMDVSVEVLQVTESRFNTYSTSWYWLHADPPQIHPGLLFRHMTLMWGKEQRKEVALNCSPPCVDWTELYRLFIPHSLLITFILSSFQLELELLRWLSQAAASGSDTQDFAARVKQINSLSPHWSQGTRANSNKSGPFCSPCVGSFPLLLGVSTPPHNHLPLICYWILLSGIGGPVSGIFCFRCRNHFLAGLNS